MLLVFLIVALIAFGLNYLWQQRKFLALTNQIPGVKFEIPFVGILLDLIFVKYEAYLPLIVGLFKDSPSGLSRRWLGPKLLVLVNSPENLQAMLNSPHCNKRPAFFYEAYLAKDGLVIANGGAWEHHRRVLNNSFSNQMLPTFVKIFDERSCHYVQRLEKEKVGRGCFNVYNIVAGCTLESLLQGSLDFSRNFYEHEYFEDVERLKHCTMKRMFQPWLRYEPLFRMTRLYEDIRREYASTVALADEIINANHHLRVASVEVKNRNVISQLLNASNNFSDNEIRDEIITFIIVGHETSALSLSAAILMLAQHEDVQERVVREIAEVVGSNDGMVDMEVLQKLTYTEAVIKEAMRLFPVVPAFSREATDDFVLDGYVIPKGALLISSIYYMHRNEKYWGDDAHLFRPERFIDSKIHPYTFVPFTGGRRICLGWRYTMLFKKAFLVNFLREFVVSTELKFDKLKVAMTPTVAIEQKYMISINKRKRN